ncbi:MAG: serine/threonine-protein phosphatase [Firmicutes bacterium]|nr:serine/threonine-protein phosphatase [Bacillota bacterium]
MNSDISFYSSRGGRVVNQDSVKVLKSGDRVLIAAADGMGGTAGGEVASETAVRSVAESLSDSLLSADLLYDAVIRANKAVLQCAQDRSPRTTLSVLWFDREQALAANIGDTRIYQFRSGGIRFQSVDHTVAQMSVMAGELAKEEIRSSRERFQLIQALGSEDGLRVDLQDLDILEGDAFLICTDGFWEYVVEEEMLSDLGRSADSRQWLELMKARVTGRLPDRADNHSAAAIMIS